MLNKVLKCFLVLLTVLFDTQAFWWQPSTTEAPAVSVKHIPLTYFRTYTYQPLPGGPFSFPLSFGGSPQTPILNGARYDQYNYGVGSPLSPQRLHPLQSMTTTTTAAPTTPSTTTTTTTTPPPTTTTSTTTTTTTTASPPTQSSIEPLINSGGGTYGPLPQYESSIYPTYNRRLYVNNYNGGNFYRPHYPYPDYATATKMASMFASVPQRTPNVQFVPCMCPVSVAGVGIGDPTQNFYMAQGRSNDLDSNSDMEHSLDGEDRKESNIGFNQVEETQHSDDTLLSDHDESILLETNKIDSGYRKPKVDETEVISS